MADNKILTADTTSGVQADPVTGTSVSGSKRGADVHPVGASVYFDLVNLVLSGQASLPNYDSITVSVISSTQINYIFKSGISDVFTVSVTGTDTESPVATYTAALANLLLESGDLMLLENDDELLKESA